MRSLGGFSICCRLLSSGAGRGLSGTVAATVSREQRREGGGEREEEEEEMEEEERQKLEEEKQAELQKLQAEALVKQDKRKEALGELLRSKVVSV